MPSSATLTAFYSFTANTKARASEVNTNFDTFRGHLIPIDPNTVTSTDLQHDLGALDHRWRAVYAKTVDPGTTTGLTIAIAGTTVGQFDSGGFQGKFIKAASTTLTSFADKRTKAAATAIAAGEIGFMGSIILSNLTSGAGTSNIAGTTMTVACTGRPIGFNIRGNIDLFYQTTTLLAGSQISCILRFTLTNTSQVGSGSFDKTVAWRPGDFTTTAFQGARNQQISFDIGGLHAFIPFAVGLTGTWLVYCQCIVTGSLATAAINANVDVFEL